LERGVVGHEEVPADLREVLDDRFADSNNRLGELIDVNLEWLDRKL
jgi:hypothetical protein